MAHNKQRKSYQFAASCALVIPDDKKEAEFLLRATSMPVVDQCVVSQGQVSISGYINIFIEYVAAVDDDTQPVSCLFYKLPFDKTIPYRHAREGMSIALKCDITNQYMYLSNSREITIATNIKISSLKLAPPYHSLPPHRCKPYFINFLEAGYPDTYMSSYTPEPSSCQPHNLQPLQDPDSANSEHSNK